MGELSRRGISTERFGCALWVDLALGGGIAAFGCYEAASLVHVEDPGVLPRLAIGLGMGIAVGLSRRQPALALATLWIIAGVQLLSTTDSMLVELAVAIVMYGNSRYGSTATVWAGGLSLPIAYLVGAGYAWAHGAEVATVLRLGSVSTFTARPTLAFVTAAALTLALPWLLGLILRIRSHAMTSQRERIEADRLRELAESRRAEAEELARVREEQARLARDVHDVVGHSLAVILAQAESASFLPDSEPARLKEVIGTIASSARTSLQDVRRVLSNRSDPDPSLDASVDGLIQRLEEAGAHVDQTTIGLPRPLAPDLATVAYQVLQEMLTNALKHGVRTEPIAVAQDWSRGLTLEVRNATRESQQGVGLGLNGMRTRLASVQGSLTTNLADGTFVTAAWIPIGATSDEHEGEQ